MDMKKTGQYIKEERKRRKLTQNDLAKKINRTESSIRKYEKGLVDIPNKVLNEIALALDVPVSQLIRDTFFSKLENEINSKRIILYDLSLQLVKKGNEFQQIVDQLENNSDDDNLNEKHEKVSKELEFMQHNYSKTQYELDELVKELRDGEGGTSNYNELNEISSTEEGKTGIKNLIKELDDIKRAELREKLLIRFDKLNPAGKSEAIKRIDELTQIPAYTKDETIK